MQEWISVLEELPPDGVRVLTTDKFGNMYVRSHIAVYKYPFNIGFDDKNYYEVTHWQRLPKPPEECSLW